jgi:hypothetical protein
LGLLSEIYTNKKPRASLGFCFSVFLSAAPMHIDWLGTIMQIYYILIKNGLK